MYVMRNQFNTICCYAAPERWQEERVTLGEVESTHLVRVLRKREGDEVTVLDGAGCRAQAVLETASKHNAVLRLKAVEVCEPPQVEVVLVQALLKHVRMEWIVQKAVELGVTEIWPVETTHCVAKAGKDKNSRMHDIAVSALKQSGNLFLPGVKPVMGLSACLNALQGVVHTYVGSLEAETLPFRDALRRAECPVHKVVVFVGPEGDFTAAEYAQLRDFGAAPVCLGPNVLRAETAAMVMCSNVRYEFG